MERLERQSRVQSLLAFWSVEQCQREVGTSIGIIYEVSTERLLEEGKS